MTVFQVLHKATWLGQMIRNTFYYVTTVGDPTTAEWQTIANEIRADFVSALQTRISNDYTLTGISHRRVDAPGYLGIDETFTSGPVPGSNTQDNCATQVSIVVSNKGSTTKPNHCRTYLAGVCENEITDSVWSPGMVSSAQTFCDLQSNLNGGGTNPLSRVAVTWDATRTYVIAWNDMSGAASVASSIPATQRRRRIGVGA